MSIIVIVIIIIIPENKLSNIIRSFNKVHAHLPHSPGEILFLPAATYPPLTDYSPPKHNNSVLYPHHKNIKR